MPPKISPSLTFRNAPAAFLRPQSSCLYTMALHACRHNLCTHFFSPKHSFLSSSHLQGGSRTQCSKGSLLSTQAWPRCCSAPQPVSSLSHASTPTPWPRLTSDLHPPLLPMASIALPSASSSFSFAVLPLSPYWLHAPNYDERSPSSGRERVSGRQRAQPRAPLTHKNEADPNKGSSRASRFSRERERERERERPVLCCCPQCSPLASANQQPPAIERAQECRVCYALSSCLRRERELAHEAGRRPSGQPKIPRISSGRSEVLSTWLPVGGFFMAYRQVAGGFEHMERKAGRS
ncbi:hypothetical protein L7F22_059282 [Adiantum nelumboides]|nr:hypothetical protein [Adiantum nelumboides]